jgi:hypothetical protein
LDEVTIVIGTGTEAYIPVLLDGVLWTTDCKGTPGRLDFKLLNTPDLDIEEGNHVRLKIGDRDLFYGFVFLMSCDGDIVNITAYDQLRYLKNKDTIIYKNMKADGLIKMIGEQFKLRVGELSDTGFVIAKRIEDDQTLIDMIKTALDITLRNTGKLFVLYDDFGKIALKNIEEMQLDILIDEESASSFSFKSSIDSGTYNQIKLARSNEKTGKRDIYIAKDSEKQNAWGILQYYGKLQEGENGSAKADALLKLYNKKNKSYSVKKAFGDLSVRGGSSVIVYLDIGIAKLEVRMVVDRVRHSFSNGEHFMDMDLRGGG